MSLLRGAFLGLRGGGQIRGLKDAATAMVSMDRQQGEKPGCCSRFWPKLERPQKQLLFSAPKHSLVVVVVVVVVKALLFSLLSLHELVRFASAAFEGIESRRVVGQPRALYY